MPSAEETLHTEHDDDNTNSPDTMIRDDDDVKDTKSKSKSKSRKKERKGRDPSSHRGGDEAGSGKEGSTRELLALDTDKKKSSKDKKKDRKKDRKKDKSDKNSSHKYTVVESDPENGPGEADGSAPRSDKKEGKSTKDRKSKLAKDGELNESSTLVEMKQPKKVKRHDKPKKDGSSPHGKDDRKKRDKDKKDKKDDHGDKEKKSTPKMKHPKVTKLQHLDTKESLNLSVTLLDSSQHAEAGGEPGSSPRRMAFADEEHAATAIQAAYRGHRTRKSDKGKEVAKVRKTHGGDGHHGSSGDGRGKAKDKSKDKGTSKRKSKGSSPSKDKDKNKKESSSKTPSHKKNKAKTEEEAAVAIQSAYRGHKVRQSVKGKQVSTATKHVNKKDQDSTMSEEKAATSIQAAFRGHQGRKEVVERIRAQDRSQASRFQTAEDLERYLKEQLDIDALETSLSKLEMNQSLSSSLKLVKQPALDDDHGVSQVEKRIQELQTSVLDSYARSKAFKQASHAATMFARVELLRTDLLVAQQALSRAQGERDRIRAVLSRLGNDEEDDNGSKNAISSHAAAILRIVRKGTDKRHSVLKSNLSEKIKTYQAYVREITHQSKLQTPPATSLAGEYGQRKKALLLVELQTVQALCRIEKEAVQSEMTFLKHNIDSRLSYHKSKVKQAHADNEARLNLDLDTAVAEVTRCEVEISSIEAQLLEARQDKAVIPPTRPCKDAMEKASELVETYREKVAKDLLADMTRDRSALVQQHKVELAIFDIKSTAAKQKHDTMTAAITETWEQVRSRLSSHHQEEIDRLNAKEDRFRKEAKAALNGIDPLSKAHSVRVRRKLDKLRHLRNARETVHGAGVDLLDTRVGKEKEHTSELFQAQRLRRQHVREALVRDHEGELVAFDKSVAALTQALQDQRDGSVEKELQAATRRGERRRGRQSQTSAQRAERRTRVIARRGARREERATKMTAQDASASDSTDNEADLLADSVGTSTSSSMLSPDFTSSAVSAVPEPTDEFDHAAWPHEVRAGATLATQLALAVHSSTLSRRRTVNAVRTHEGHVQRLSKATEHVTRDSERAREELASRESQSERIQTAKVASIATMMGDIMSMCQSRAEGRVTSTETVHKILTDRIHARGRELRPEEDSEHPAVPTANVIQAACRVRRYHMRDLNIMLDAIATEQQNAASELARRASRIESKYGQIQIALSTSLMAIHELYDPVIAANEKAVSSGELIAQERVESLNRQSQELMSVYHTLVSQYSTYQRRLRLLKRAHADISTARQHVQDLKDTYMAEFNAASDPGAFDASKLDSEVQHARDSLSKTLTALETIASMPDVGLGQGEDNDTTGPRVVKEGGRIQHIDPELSTLLGKRAALSDAVNEAKLNAVTGARRTARLLARKALTDTAIDRLQVRLASAESERSHRATILKAMLDAHISRGQRADAEVGFQMETVARLKGELTDHLEAIHKAENRALDDAIARAAKKAKDGSAGDIPEIATEDHGDGDGDGAESKPAPEVPVVVKLTPEMVEDEAFKAREILASIHQDELKGLDSEMAMSVTELMKERGRKKKKYDQSTEAMKAQHKDILSRLDSKVKKLGKELGKLEKKAQTEQAALDEANTSVSATGSLPGTPARDLRRRETQSLLSARTSKTGSVEGSRADKKSKKKQGKDSTRPSGDQIDAKGKTHHKKSPRVKSPFPSPRGDGRDTPAKDKRQRSTSKDSKKSESSSRSKPKKGKSKKKQGDNFLLSVAGGSVYSLDDSHKAAFSDFSKVVYIASTKFAAAYSRHATLRIKLAYEQQRERACKETLSQLARDFDARQAEIEVREAAMAMNTTIRRSPSPSPNRIGGTANTNASPSPSPVTRQDSGTTAQVANSLRRPSSTAIPVVVQGEVPKWPVDNEARDSAHQRTIDHDHDRASARIAHGKATLETQRSTSEKAAHEALAKQTSRVAACELELSIAAGEVDAARADAQLTVARSLGEIYALEGQCQQDQTLHVLSGMITALDAVASSSDLVGINESHSNLGSSQAAANEARSLRGKVEAARQSILEEPIDSSDYSSHGSQFFEVLENAILGTMATVFTTRFRTAALAHVDRVETKLLAASNECVSRVSELNSRAWTKLLSRQHLVPLLDKYASIYGHCANRTVPDTLDLVLTRAPRLVHLSVPQYIDTLMFDAAARVETSARYITSSLSTLRSHHRSSLQRREQTWSSSLEVWAARSQVAADIARRARLQSANSAKEQHEIVRRLGARHDVTLVQRMAAKPTPVLDVLAAISTLVQQLGSATHMSAGGTLGADLYLDQCPEPPEYIEPSPRLSRSNSTTETETVQSGKDAAANAAFKGAGGIHRTTAPVIMMSKGGKATDSSVGIVIAPMYDGADGGGDDDDAYDGEHQPGKKPKNITIIADDSDSEAEGGGFCCFGGGEAKRKREAKQVKSVKARQISTPHPSKLRRQGIDPLALAAHNAALNDDDDDDDDTNKLGAKPSRHSRGYLGKGLGETEGQLTDRSDDSAVSARSDLSRTSVRSDISAISATSEVVVRRARRQVDPLAAKLKTKRGRQRAQSRANSRGSDGGNKSPQREASDKDLKRLSAPPAAAGRRRASTVTRPPPLHGMR